VAEEIILEIPLELALVVVNRSRALQTVLVAMVEEEMIL
jgi:hypothetical protein